MSAYSSGASAASTIVEPVRAAPTKGLSLGGPSKNNTFLKAMAVEDNVNFFQKSAERVGGGGGGGGGSGGGGGGSAATEVVPVPAASRGPVGDLEVTCTEVITVLATRDSDLQKMEVRGTMTLTAHTERAGLATVKFSRRELEGLTLQPNPILDRKALAQNIIRPRAPTKPFPVGAAAGVIKWKLVTEDKAQMPLSVNVWPEASGRNITVSLEYNLENVAMSLHDVCITVPLGCSATPEIVNADGVARHVAKTESIEWRHELIDAESNPSGQLEFVVPTAGGASEDGFFPCTVQFSTNFNYGGFRFEAAVDAEKGPLKVVADTSMQVGEYTVS